MRVVVCAIAKNENKYINEWAHHYFNLGFDHIYLYDNNFSKDPYVGDCFDVDIKNKITIFNVNNICGESIQERCYNNFYNTYKNDFDWCLFCDIDEFLDNTGEIHEFLSQEKFNKFNQIRIRWKLFGDDDLIERDESIPVYQFFKKPILDNEGYSTQGKAILRGHIEDDYLNIWLHVAYSKKNTIITCLPSGKEYEKNSTNIRSLNNVYDYENETVFINHYRTKTLKEFLEQKYGRTCCDTGGFVTLDMSYFFSMNKNTPEKQEYIKKWLQKKIEERRK